ncbi:MAG: 16S rRNA (guanine(966)-N(2))-methyltransferase RsmD [Bacteroidota bacterium]
MRIIGGKFKGRVVKFPKSNLVRPTTDKVKESLFNYLIHLIEFEDILVLDLYAGSGSLGLEALSRGAKEVHFVEKDYNVYKVLKENILSLHAEDSCKTFRMDAVRFSKTASNYKYQLILADPPFFKYDVHKVVENVLSNRILDEAGLMLVERSIQTKDEDEKNFGSTAFKRIGDSLIYQFGY